MGYPGDVDAVIVGGGVGGLATGVALGRAGWSVEVREQRDDPADTGSGLSIWPNALRALDVLGVGDAVRAAGTVQATGGVRDRAGRWLVRTDTDVLAARYGDPVVVLARADLISILGDALPAGVLRTGVAVDGIPDAELVVGADGIGSTVRVSVDPAARPRSTGTTAWRLVATLDEPLTEGGETWGDGLYAGLAPLPGAGRAYLWAVTPTGVADDLAALRRCFAGWHRPIPELLERVDPADALRTELLFLPPLRSLAAGRVALLGDAAHAMTPNLGQGACLAIEDAVTLAACLPRPGGVAVDVPGGLARYDARRRPRVARLARLSRRAGQLAGLSGRAAAARDAVIGALPSSLAVRALDPVLGWRPDARA